MEGNTAAFGIWSTCEAFQVAEAAVHIISVFARLLLNETVFKFHDHELLYDSV